MDNAVEDAIDAMEQDWHRGELMFKCPKCNRHGLLGVRRAKILVCYYDDCHHVINTGTWDELTDKKILEIVAADKEKTHE